MTLVEAIDSGKAWVLSDLHLFSEKDKHDEQFFNFWVDKINRFVKPSHHLIFLGDIVDTEGDLDREFNESKRFLDSLKCKNVTLVMGNNEQLPAYKYYDAGYSKVSTRIDTSKYILSHYPIEIPDGKINIHGHIHGSKVYWNVNWKNHIDAFFKINSWRVLTIKQYVERMHQGIYDGKTIFRESTENKHIVSLLEIYEKNSVKFSQEYWFGEKNYRGSLVRNGDPRFSSENTNNKADAIIATIKLELDDLSGFKRKVDYFYKDGRLYINSTETLAHVSDLIIYLFEDGVRSKLTFNDFKIFLNINPSL